MAYIGRGIDKISNIEVLDAITFTNSAGPYNITQSSTAFTPTASNALVISIDGVVQSPGSYTLSAATITFDSSMSSASTMNFIYQIGTGLITEPSDDSVTAAKIATDAVTTVKIKDLNVTAGKLAATQDLSTKTITLPATVAGLGTGITNAQLAGSITDAKITGLSSSKLTGALPAISGASLTALPATLPVSSGVNLTDLNATNLGSGTVATARLGTGTASSSTILYGDQTYKTEPTGGKILQVLEDTTTTQIATTGTVFIAGGLSQAITPASTSNKIMIICSFLFTQLSSTKNAVASIFRDSTNLAGGDLDLARFRIDTTNNYIRECITILDAPSSTSEIIYTLQFKNYGSGGDARVHATDAKGSLVLMEVAG